MQPNNALKLFHDKFCPNLSYDDPKIFYKLLEEIKKLKEKKFKNI